MIPKVLYCYWNKKLTQFLKECINSWKIHNPDYKIIIINDKNVKQYSDIKRYKNVDSVQRFSDYLRLDILSKYGGIWCDISTFMTAPLNFVNENQKYEIVGFSYPDNSCNNTLENWFIACQKNSLIIKKWKDKFFQIDNWYKFNNDTKNINIECVHNLTNSGGYLSMHLCFNLLIYENPEYLDKIKLFKSTDGPFKIHASQNWKEYNIAKEFIKLKDQNNLPKPFVKLRGIERNKLENILKKQSNGKNINKEKNNGILIILTIILLSILVVYFVTK